MAANRHASTGLLIQWVKQYRDQHGGRLPSPSSIPSDLAPVYSGWLASVKNCVGQKGPGPRSVLGPSDSGHVASDNKEGSFQLHGGSFSVDTHVSDTPTKSARSQGDIEYTSALTPTVPLFHDDFRSGSTKQPSAPSSTLPSKACRDAAREIKAENPAKQRRRKRVVNKENDARQQSPLAVQSPSHNVLRSPLLPSRGPIAHQSPSRVRQGAVKRKVTFSAFARCQQQPSVAPTELYPEVAPVVDAAANNSQEALAAESEQQPQQEGASADQLPEEPIVVQSGRADAPPLDSDWQCDSAACLSPVRTAVNGPSATTRVRNSVPPEGTAVKALSATAQVSNLSLDRTAMKALPATAQVSRSVPPEGTAMNALSATAQVSRSVQPAQLESAEDVTQQNGTAVKRKRRGNQYEAQSSASDVSLVCSEALSSDADSEMSEGPSECESERSPKPTAQAAKRARPAAKKGLTVAQLKDRLSERGLSTAGRKAELEDRLQNAGQASGAAEASQPAASGPRLAVGRAHKSGGRASLHAKKDPSGVFKAGKRKNFVRINLKGPSAKGKFQSKGARKFGKKRFGRFGRFQTKMLPQAGQGADYVEGCSTRSMACFKCGAEGHWAQDCPGLLEPAAEEESGDEGTRETAQLPMAQPLAVPAAAVQLPEESMTEEALTETLQSVFGFSAFRGLQLPVIQSVLRGTSTLAVLPTGAGKSLCYQVPALLCGGLVLVVSPLIALMKDQLAHLPKGLPGAMLWSGQQATQAMQTLRDVREGRIRVLYVAPERMGSPSLLSALAPMLPLPLVCIDEAHCITEWGHNFRSAYFRLGRMLRENIPCRAVLALTATATKATEASMVQALRISPSAVFRDASLRDNLRFHVHHTNGGTEAGLSKAVLLKLLRPGGALADRKAVVVYTTFQVQAEQVAAHLHSHGVPAAAYHAGKHFKERESVQDMFGKGRLRVVVATVAFGMGVDNRGVQAVVHLTLPQSLEEYVQQVGRAGRDGSEARCHLFLDDADFRRLRSLSHSDAVSAASVLQFLETVFAPGDESEGNASEEGECSRYEVLGADEMACALDMKAEVMETLLTYLEAHEESYVRVLPSVGRTSKVSFFNSTCQELAARQPALQSLLAVCPKPRGGNYNVHMARWANEAGVAPSVLLQQLAALARQDELRFEVDGKSTLTFQVVNRPDSLDDLAEELAARHTEVGRRRLRRLDTVYKMLAAAAAKPDQAAQEKHIRDVAKVYFEAEEDSIAARESARTDEGLPLVAGSNFMAKDVRMLLRESASMKVGAQLTGRAIARILHGLTSSAFPAAQWKKCGYWGRYGHVDFDAVLAMAEAELEACKD